MRTYLKQLSLVVCGVFVLLGGLTVMGAGRTGSPFVNAWQAIQTGVENSDKPTYIFSRSDLAPTGATVALTMEAGPINNVRIRKFCWTGGGATAAASWIWNITREVVAATGGTPATHTGVASTTPSLAAIDPRDADYSGVVRAGAPTAGTAGIVVMNGTHPVGALAAAGESTTVECYEFDQGTYKSPVIQAGTANGLTWNITGTAGGTGLGLIVYATEEAPNPNGL